MITEAVQRQRLEEWERLEQRDFEDALHTGDTFQADVEEDRWAVAGSTREEQLDAELDGGAE